MADAKISQLPAATTPLTGAEIFPLVQSGITKQTPVSSLINPLVDSVASASTITPPADLVNQYNVTALATNATIAIPSGGTPPDGKKLILRILDNGTPRLLTWTTSAGGYRAVGLALPGTTVAGLVMYVGFIYNAQAGYWDVIALIQE